MNLFVNVSYHPQPVSTVFSNLLLHSEKEAKFIFKNGKFIKNEEENRTCNLSLTDVCFSDASFKSCTFLRADLRLASVSDRAFSLRFSCERSFPTSTTLPEKVTKLCIFSCQIVEMKFLTKTLLFDIH